MTRAALGRDEGGPDLGLVLAAAARHGLEWGHGKVVAWL